MSTKQIGNVAARVAAKRLLPADRKWPDLSKDERAAAMKAARGQVTAADRSIAVRLLARGEARKEKKNWKEMPLEERQAFIKRVRAG